MVLDNKTKKILKIFCLVFFVAILTGCTQNLDSNGNLIFFHGGNKLHMP